MPVQTNRPPYENPPVAWPEIGAALLTVLKATWHVLRELLKLAWRVSVILVPVVFGAVLAMFLWAVRHSSDDEGSGGMYWTGPGPCGPGDFHHPDWPALFGEDEKR